MTMKVEPDLQFISFLKGAGGDTLKKCYQCATCSVVCPLASDGSPFPRKEMIWAQWGLKDKLMADVDTMLCHQCGDCTAYCPRGAKPGDVLGAIRAYTYTHYGFPQGLAKLASNGKNLPLLVGIPAGIIMLLWAISGGMHMPEGPIDYGMFFGHWNFHWLTKTTAFIDIIFLPTAFLSIFASYKGASAMWNNLASGVNANQDFRPSCKQFGEKFLWPAIKETVLHKRFNECGTNKDRVTGHLPLMLAFMGLLIVTGYSFVRKDFVGLLYPSLHGPIPMTDPFKLLANISAVALLVGIGILWLNRTKNEAETGAKPTFYDWFLIGMIMAVGVTGLGAELLRSFDYRALAYTTYYAHLVSVMMLFLYMPYTKFAHLVYRTVAMAFEKYRESSFVQKDA